MDDRLTPRQSAAKIALASIGFSPLSITLSSSSVNSIFNVIGIVVEQDAPRQANGGAREWFITFSICDYFRPSISDPVKVRVFWPNIEGLPDLKPISKSEVILLRSVKWMRIGSEKMLVSNNRFEKFAYVVLREPLRPGGATVPARSLLPEGKRIILVSEKRYCDELRKWWVSENTTTADFVQSQRASAMAVKNRDPRRLGPTLIRDLKYDHFCEVFGQVVRTFDENHCFTVDIADYTEHPELYNHEWGKQGGEYTEEQSWSGPFGKYTLHVSLWDQNADVARSEIEPGQFVCFTNMRVKMNKLGFLEGVINGDRVYPDKIDFRVVTAGDSRIDELIERREEYKRDFEAHVQKYNSVLSQRVAERDMRNNCAPQDEENEEEEEYGDKDDADKGNDDSESESFNNSTPDESEINVKIRSENPSLPITPLSEIYGLCRNHYVNQKYRIMVRVVDFLPRKLRDFAVLGPPPDDPGSDDEIDPNEYSGKLKEIWQWRFAFLVEDHKGERMRVIVSGKEADYLLKIQACDLSKDRDTLNTLRQKLSEIWGNLYDIKYSQKSQIAKKRQHNSQQKARKRQKGHGSKRVEEDHDENNSDEAGPGPDGKFFRACIAEYGVYFDKITDVETCPSGDKCDCREMEKAKGWKRMWKLFGTTMH